jgi:phosphatidylserine decarboxylase
MFFDSYVAKNFSEYLTYAHNNGNITHIEYRSGKYLPAFKSHASDINERNSVGIENGTLKIMVHQITGFIARRIVCRIGKGDKIKKGQRFGMIKFGSCTEIIVPTSVDIKIKAGDKVKGGSSIIGIFKS